MAFGTADNSKAKSYGPPHKNSKHVPFPPNPTTWVLALSLPRSFRTITLTTIYWALRSFATWHLLSQKSKIGWYVLDGKCISRTFVVLLWWNTRQSSSWEETLALPIVLVVCLAPCARGDITAVGACREALLLMGDRTRWRRLGTRHNLQSQAPGDLLKARLHLLMLPGFQCCQLETNYLTNKPTGNVLYSNCKGGTDTGSWST